MEDTLGLLYFVDKRLSFGFSSFYWNLIASYAIESLVNTFRKVICLNHTIDIRKRWQIIAKYSSFELWKKGEDSYIKNSTPGRDLTEDKNQTCCGDGRAKNHPSPTPTKSSLTGPLNLIPNWEGSSADFTEDVRLHFPMLINFVHYFTSWYQTRWSVL